MAHKLAIIGYGGMGSWHHKNIKEHIKEIEVACVYDIRPEVKEAAADNDVPFCESIETILNDPSIDIVTIATPNNFHKDLVIKCFQHGKHVICEKPVAMNSKELEEMIAAGKQYNRLFSVHQNRRWDKDYKIIQKILNDNTIGTPYFIESRVQGSRRALHGWRGYKENGGGMVYDWGVHLIDQMLDLIDSKVVSISAHLFQVYSKEVDDNFKVLMRFENGVSALVEISTNCFINQPRWHMSCTDGTVVIDNWDCEGSIVKLSSDETMEWENDIVYTSAGPTRTMAPRPKHTTTTLELPEVTAQWADYYKNITGVIDQKEDLIVKPEQALRVMNVIDTIFKSEETGNPVICNI